MWAGFFEVRPHFMSENLFNIMDKKLLPGIVDQPFCISQTCNLKVHRVETTIATRPHDLLNTRLYKRKNL